MSAKFQLVWTEEAWRALNELKDASNKRQLSPAKPKKSKATKQEGLLKQLEKCLTFLGSNPRHPGLQTHEFHSIEHPYQDGEKVFEAYVQHKTPGAYRVFWCYGPEKGQITVIAITPHP